MAAAAIFAISCNKDDSNKKGNSDKEEPDVEVEEIVPVTGESDWAIIGSFLDSSWSKDYKAAEADGIYVVKNVSLKSDQAVKFRKDGKWDENFGAEFDNATQGTDQVFQAAAPFCVKAAKDGKNLVVAADGVYDIYLNLSDAENPLLAITVKDAAPDWTNPQAKPEA